MRKPARLFSLLSLSTFLFAVVGLLSMGGGNVADNVAHGAAQDPRTSGPLSQYVVATVGCSGTSCHGGFTPRDTGDVQQNELTFCKEHDKHLRAYAILMPPGKKGEDPLHEERMRAQRMADNLAPSNADGKVIPAHKDTRCLACHATPATAIENAPAHVEALQVEGVSCQACHGPAQLKPKGWLTPHQQKGTDYKELKGVGMTQINDLVVQAGTCAGCHVGAPPGNEHGIKVPARDLNHDLMAAGHPRLNFELSVFRMNQPPHWKLTGRGDQVNQAAVNYEAKVWAVGQVASLRAQVALTQYRAEQTIANENNADAIVRWPEFAEANCFACHADFELGRPKYLFKPTDAFNQETFTKPDGIYWRAANGAAYYGKREPGAPPYDNWYGSLLGPLSTFPGWKDPGDCAKLFAELKELMSNWNADPKQVSAKAGELVKALDKWLASAPAGTLDAATLLKHLLQTQPDFDAMTWDEAMQWALAVAALKTNVYRAQDNPMLLSAINGLLNELAFPTGADGKLAYESPHGFGSITKLEALKMSLNRVIGELKK